MMRAVLSIGNLIDTRSFDPRTMSQRAVLYEESKTNATGIPFVGRAIWRANLSDTACHGNVETGVVHRRRDTTKGS